MKKWIILTMLLSLPLFGDEAALEKLVDGNARFQKGHKKAEAVQRPFAVIVACSDSRVAPEIIFDQHLGDLFVVRVAGNVVGDMDLESIRFAVDALGSSIVMVLGHENCGAVNAVMEGQTETIPAIASIVKPNIKGAKTLKEAVVANVKGVVANVSKEVDVHVVGGYYDFETGKVEVLQ